MFALIKDNKVVQVSNSQFPVSEMQWIECDDSVKTGFNFINNEFKSDSELNSLSLNEMKLNKLNELDSYHFNNTEIRQCKINNYFILQLSGEGRSLIQEQISLLTQKIKLNLVTEEDASFEYFYNGGSIEITLVQLRQIYVAMLDIVNSNYQNYKAETYLIKNLGSVEAVESHDFTVNYLKNQNITL